MRDIVLTINGMEHTVKADDDALLLDVVRKAGGCGSVREGCGVGVCGACTAVVDGVPISTCLALVGRYDGAEIPPRRACRPTIPSWRRSLRPAPCSAATAPGSYSWSATCWRAILTRRQPRSQRASPQTRAAAAPTPRSARPWPGPPSAGVALT